MLDASKMLEEIELSIIESANNLATIDWFIFNPFKLIFPATDILRLFSLSIDVEILELVVKLFEIFSSTSNFS